MFEEIQRRKEPKQFRQNLSDLTTEQGYLDIAEYVESFEPVHEDVPIIQELQAIGLSQTAADVLVWIWEYIESPEIRQDIEHGLTREHPTYATALKRADMLPDFMWQIKAIMDSIINRRIPDPDRAIIKKAIPRLIQQVMCGSDQEFYQARNELLNITNDMAQF
jgi:hypothetical protein